MRTAHTDKRQKAKWMSLVTNMEETPQILRYLEAGCYVFQQSGKQQQATGMQKER